MCFGNSPLECISPNRISSTFEGILKQDSQKFLLYFFFWAFKLHRPSVSSRMRKLKQPFHAVQCDMFKNCLLNMDFFPKSPSNFDNCILNKLKYNYAVQTKCLITMSSPISALYGKLFFPHPGLCSPLVLLFWTPSTSYFLTQRL